ncbi:hypothetical protein V5799_017903 [Amblyomma americanum]|uniref:Uncharacterized protein n=1 Tax=Amblyomma americanum TaxID=6943 RepID=A0AAQ4F0U7_AMBAM
MQRSTVSGRDMPGYKEEEATNKKACIAGTGSAATQCPFYRRLHTFLGNLPMNDRSLVQEIFKLDMVERLPEDAEIIV